MPPCQTIQSSLSLRARRDITSSCSVFQREYPGLSFGRLVVGLVYCGCRSLLLGYYSNITSDRVYGWSDGLCTRTPGLGPKRHL